MYYVFSSWLDTLLEVFYRAFVCEKGKNLVETRHASIKNYVTVTERKKTECSHSIDNYIINNYIDTQTKQNSESKYVCACVFSGCKEQESI